MIYFVFPFLGTEHCPPAVQPTLKMGARVSNAANIIRAQEPISIACHNSSKPIISLITLIKLIFFKIAFIVN